MSCDAGPNVASFGNGASGGPTGVSPVPVNPTGRDTNRPFVRIDTPITAQLVNVGDSILTVVTFIDDRKLGSLSITGYKETGDTALGTYTRTIRYTTVTAPAAGQPFQPGQVVAQVRRFLRPAQPVDTSIGPLLLIAVGQDSAGNIDSALVRVQLVTGPRVTITQPANGDSVPRGIAMSVAARATSGAGVSRITIRVQGEATWPTLLDTTFTQTYPGGTLDITLIGAVPIPPNAPLRGRITVTATAVDVNSNPGSAAPILVFVRAQGTLAPRVCFAGFVNGQAVCQATPSKLEMTDSVMVKADGDGITSVGIIIRDSLGTQLARDSVVYAAPFVSNQVQKLPLFGVGIGSQGQRINIVAFAYDNNAPPGVGYSMVLGTSTPITVEANASADTTLIAFGRTFPMPRAGIAGDLAVDELRGNVFLSNTSFNLLEVWSNASKTFAPSGVAVGALPWGLFVSNNPDTMYVGNSGATTISRVCINPAVCAGGAMGENLAGRLRTRNTIIFQVQWTRNINTGKIILARLPDVSYSDRPQYVAQSTAGRVFFSTRPTSSATPGTLRFVDPAFQFADTRQIWQYGNVSAGGDVQTFAILNVDSIAILPGPPNTAKSDVLFLYDHAKNQLGPNFVVSDSLPIDAGIANNAGGGDATVILGLDVNSLSLTDTTFVAASGDRTWIGFGEGHTGGVGRVIMSHDPNPADPEPPYFSPHTTVRDITDNASEKVFGIAIDRTGLQITAHGAQTYVAAIDDPFHLRLDGVYDSFDNGVGVAYHPNANSTLSANADRVLFTATNNGIIEIVDVAHYNNRGRLVSKNDFYGPLRATLPIAGDNAALVCPGDPNCVILKLYALSSKGLVVIDLRASDIKPGP